MSIAGINSVFILVKFGHSHPIILLLLDFIFIKLYGVYSNLFCLLCISAANTSHKLCLHDFP